MRTAKATSSAPVSPPSGERAVAVPHALTGAELTRLLSTRLTTRLLSHMVASSIVLGLWLLEHTSSCWELLRRISGLMARRLATFLKRLVTHTASGKQSEMDISFLFGAFEWQRKPHSKTAAFTAEILRSPSYPGRLTLPNAIASSSPDGRNSAKAGRLSRSR